MNIIHAQSEHTAKIRELLIDIWYATYQGLLPDDVIKQATQKWFAEKGLQEQIENDDYVFLVAVTEDGKLAGLTTAKLIKPSTMHLLRLYVLPEYQGIGLGTLLYKSALEQFHGISTVRLGVIEGNQKAIRFYENQGFIKTGEEKESFHNYEMIIWVMEKLII